MVKSFMFFSTLRSSEHAFIIRTHCAIRRFQAITRILTGSFSSASKAGSSIRNVGNESILNQSVAALVSKGKAW